MGVIAFAVMAGIAWHIGEWFQLDAIRARTGATVMLLVAAQFAIGFPFGCFGAIVNGFQRQYVNATIGLAVTVAVAIVNVAVLLAGGGLVLLVAAATLTRISGFLLYRLNAYRVFPSLHVRPSLVRWGRVREMSGFSVYMLVQDLSSRANYASDPILIAAMLSTGSVAVWTVAQRLADVVLQLTNQLNQVLFPVVVECDTTRRDDRLRDLLVQGTRLSLATSLPVAGTLAFFADSVIRAWTGPDLTAAADILQVLALAVVVRVGSATAGMVLQGGGAHRLLAGSNLVAAVINVVLSVALVARYGLPGVAFATLLPIACRGAFILIPSACVPSRHPTSSVLRERRVACAVARGHRSWWAGDHRAQRARPYPERSHPERCGWVTVYGSVPVSGCDRTGPESLSRQAAQCCARTGVERGVEA